MTYEVLVETTDGGPDHRFTLQNVLTTNVDKLVVIRGFPPGLSYPNTAERTMLVLNIGLEKFVTNKNFSQQIG